MVSARVAIPLAIFLVLSQGHLGRCDVSKEGTLKGLERVDVIIEHIDQVAKDDGLDQDGLKTETELRLRNAGLVVDHKTIPFVYVNVTTLKLSSGAYVFSAEVDLSELAFTRGTVLSAKTWSESTVGYSSASDINDMVLKAVTSDVDKFVNEWLRDNPKH
jgi:hypothetical protein